jgi:hypothetical protein
MASSTTLYLHSAVQIQGWKRRIKQFHNTTRLTGNQKIFRGFVLEKWANLGNFCPCSPCKMGFCQFCQVYKKEREILGASQKDEVTIFANFSQ